MLKYATVITWDEIAGAETMHAKNDEDIVLTSDNDDTLIQELRDLNEETPDVDGDGESYYWRLIGIAKTERTTLVEFRSGRGHHATSQINWMGQYG